MKNPHTTNVTSSLLYSKNIIVFHRFYPYFGFDKPIHEFRQREGYTYQLILLHPYSRGEIRLSNTNPLTPPIIDPHYLEDERDVDVLVEVYYQEFTTGSAFPVTKVYFSIASKSYISYPQCNFELYSYKRKAKTLGHTYRRFCFA